MLKPNPDRNRIIYPLWEKGLTVGKIASETGIPRSTVGYYVRKFNRLAVDGKPVVLPQERSAVHMRATSSQSVKAQIKWKKNVIDIHENIRTMFGNRDYQNLYYLLTSLKMLKDAKNIVSVEALRGLAKDVRKSSQEQ